MAFSTKDMDQDKWSGSCSETRGHGGWWFNGCGLANLNGKNLGQNQNSYDGILWYFYAKDNRSFKSSSMMVKKKWFYITTFFSIWECQKHPQRRDGFIISFIFECRISKNWARINIFHKYCLIIAHFLFYLLKLFTIASRAQTEQSMYNVHPSPFENVFDTLP